MPVGTGSRHVRMIFDSGASCTAMPAKIGEGYSIREDQYTGSEYGGAMEGVVAKDKGTRKINVFNSKWTRMPMRHRVVENMKTPLISAGETADFGNLVFMSPEVRSVLRVAAEL